MVRSQIVVLTFNYRWLQRPRLSLLTVAESKCTANMNVSPRITQKCRLLWWSLLRMDYYICTFWKCKIKLWYNKLGLLIITYFLYNWLTEIAAQRTVTHHLKLPIAGIDYEHKCGLEVNWDEQEHTTEIKRGRDAVKSGMIWDETAKIRLDYDAWWKCSKTYLSFIFYRTTER